MKNNQLFKRSFTPLNEYLAGLYASGVLQRIARPTLGMMWVCALFIGCADAVTRWQKLDHLFLWARLVSGFILAATVALFIVDHVRKTRTLGRTALLDQRDR